MVGSAPVVLRVGGDNDGALDGPPRAIKVFTGSDKSNEARGNFHAPPFPG